MILAALGIASIAFFLGFLVAAMFRSNDRVIRAPEDAVFNVPASREEVYKAIDSERNYQQMRIVRDGSTATNENPHTPEEFLLYMEHYMFLARQTASTVWGPKCKPILLSDIRKVLALGVACMEIHGAPHRDMPQ
jgi:hypothetical protein